MKDEPKREEVRVPVIEEDLVTGTREVKTGAIRVRKRVEHIRKRVEMPVVRDVLRVDRVPVNRAVKTIPQMREENGVLIVPVIEEQIVVTRRMVLKEELHITRRQVEEQATRDVSLTRERATIERIDDQGNVIARSNPPERRARPAKKPADFFREKGLL